MSAAREYRRLVLRMSEASLAREERKGRARAYLGVFAFSLAAVVILGAVFSAMGRSSLLGRRSQELTAGPANDLGRPGAR